MLSFYKFKTGKERRLFLTRIFIYLSVLLLGFTWSLSSKVYYSKAYNSISDSWRLVWVLFSVIIGLALRAYRYREDPGSPFVPYLKYFGYLCVVNFLLFALCHTTLNITTWIYYPVALIAGVAFAQPDGLLPKMQGLLAQLVGIKCE